MERGPVTPQRSATEADENFSRGLRCGDPLRVTDPGSVAASPARLQFDFGLGLKRGEKETKPR